MSRGARWRRALYVSYTNPAALPPLERGARLLAEDGWEVLLLGTGAFGAADSLRFRPREGVTVRRMPICPAGWRQKLHFLGFSLWVLFWVARWRPQLVYASDPLSCPVVWALSFVPGLRILYHEHDTPMDRPASLPMRLCLAARRSLATRAELCLLPNPERAARFAREMAPRGPCALSVRNCPSRSEVAPRRGPHDGGSVWLLYCGSVVPARLPPAVLRALGRLPTALKLRVLGYETVGHAGYPARLRQMAEELVLGDRFEWLGAVPTRDELLEWGRRCDLGLALMPRGSDDVNMRHMAGASNKPFDYLACGLALLVSDLPDWRRMYVEPGYALACDPEGPESIASALGWFLDHRREMREMGERGRVRVLEEWNYEREFEPVLWRMREPRPPR